MSSNQTRGTPGMMLLGFACVLLLSAASAWEWRREGARAAATGLSGLGDTAFYTGISDNDFEKPALVFSKAPKGLFRMTKEPVPKDDAVMRRIEKESSGRFVVYTDASSTSRWYLKAAGGRYLEFGPGKP